MCQAGKVGNPANGRASAADGDKDVLGAISKTLSAEYKAGLELV